MAEAYSLGLNPLEGDALVFIGRDRRKMKIIHSDPTGLWVSCKVFHKSAMKTLIEFTFGAGPVFSWQIMFKRRKSDGSYSKGRVRLFLSDLHIDTKAGFEKPDGLLVIRAASERQPNVTGHAGNPNSIAYLNQDS